jgi:hypothetical protein
MQNRGYHHHVVPTTGVFAPTARFYTCRGNQYLRSCTQDGVRLFPYAIFIKTKPDVATCRMECGRHAPFTCAAECGKLNSDMRDALKLPTNVSCVGRGTVSSGKWQLGVGDWRPAARGVGPEVDGRAADLWAGMRTALAAAGEDIVRLPERRTDAVDWVRDGVHMPRWGCLKRPVRLGN